MEKLLQEYKTQGGNNEYILTGQRTKNIFFSYEGLQKYFFANTQPHS